VSPDRPNRRDWLRWVSGAAGATLAGCAPRPDPADADAARAGAPRGGWVGDDAARGHRLRDGSRGAGAADPAEAATEPARRVDVLIVGAGIAGLACAQGLIAAGIEDLAVLELADRPGGNSRGHRLGGLDCPLGAHYLPVPGDDQPELLAWLESLGLSRVSHGHRQWDERHLAHSPQERLFIEGAWHEGLVPPAEALGERAAARYRLELKAFAQALDATAGQLAALGAGRPAFALPSVRGAWTAAHAELDAQTFAHWLDTRGLAHPALRWYLDYVCRDDYGAPAAQVSAWAGLHYFASRHGFGAGDDGAAPDAAEPVLTWPEGNAWLVQRLAAPLGERLRCGRLVTAVEQRRHTIEISAWNPTAEGAERWVARQVVIAVPMFVARRLVSGLDAALGAALGEAAARLTHAPWLVANLRLAAPLADRLGAAPAWDNVIFGSTGLGYVDAGHQSLRSTPGPTVLTAYRALGGDAPTTRRARAQLLDQPWPVWLERVLEPLASAHPDLASKVVEVAMTRLGHAMPIPAPGVRSLPSLQALATHRGPVHFAHSDLAGYSVFEEAFAQGRRAAAAVARQLKAGAG
jgi:monoamine oxidase